MQPSSVLLNEETSFGSRYVGNRARRLFLVDARILGWRHPILLRKAMRRPTLVAYSTTFADPNSTAVALAICLIEFNEHKTVQRRTIRVRAVRQTNMVQTQTVQTCRQRIRTRFDGDATPTERSFVAGSDDPLCEPRCRATIGRVPERRWNIDRFSSCRVEIASTKEKESISRAPALAPHQTNTLPTAARKKFSCSRERRASRKADCSTTKVSDVNGRTKGESTAAKC